MSRAAQSRSWKGGTPVRKRKTRAKPKSKATGINWSRAIERVITNLTTEIEQAEEENEETALLEEDLADVRLIQDWIARDQWIAAARVFQSLDRSAQRLFPARLSNRLLSIAVPEQEEEEEEDVPPPPPLEEEEEVIPPPPASEEEEEEAKEELATARAVYTTRSCDRTFWTDRTMAALCRDIKRRYVELSPSEQQHILQEYNLRPEELFLEEGEEQEEKKRQLERSEWIWLEYVPYQKEIDPDMPSEDLSQLGAAQLDLFLQEEKRMPDSPQELDTWWEERRRGKRR